MNLRFIVWLVCDAGTAFIHGSSRRTLLCAGTMAQTMSSRMLAFAVFVVLLRRGAATFEGSATLHFRQKSFGATSDSATDSLAFAMVLSEQVPPPDDERNNPS